MGSQHVYLSGVTWAESQEHKTLDVHLRHLEAHKVSLLDRRRHCASLEVNAELDVELQAAEHCREPLSSKKQQLKVL